MRLLIIILLFSIKAQGQVINASAPYSPRPMLLDQYGGAAAAFSLRKLRLSYSGSAIRVRRSSDNQESDIGFDALGNLDTASLKSFVGANNGFVTTWYDQSGNGRNVGGNTAQVQPRIVSSGVIETLNGKPAIYAHASQVALSFSTGINVSWVFAPFNLKQLTTLNYLINSSISGKGIILGGTFAGHDGVIVGGDSYSLFTVDETLNVSKLSVCKAQSNGSTIWINGAQIANDNRANTLNNIQNILGSTDGSRNSFATIPEIILYNSDQTNNRQGLQNNINAYYSIY